MTTPPLALVTGANRGLGQAVALALADAGYRVVVGHRPGSDPAATLDAVAGRGGEALPLPLDLAGRDGFAAVADALRAAVADRWGAMRVDLLVNNAGLGLFDPVDEVTPDGFDAMVAANLRGPFFLVQALLPLLEGGGHVVTVSTSLTRHVSPATAAYAATKAGAEALSRSLAGELGHRGVRVNTVAPGPTATDFNGGAMRDDQDLRAAIASATALGRVGVAEEVAAAVVALASDGMRWVTGERIEVSGGAFL